MNINQKILSSLTEIIDGNIWALSKPPEEDPDTYIVFNPEFDEAADYGDDGDLEWNQYMQVHWFSRGRVDYLSARKKIRKALREAGLNVTEITVTYDQDSGKNANTGWTHMTFSCSDEEEDPYGSES